MANRKLMTMLTDLALEENKRKHPEFPDFARPKTKYSDTTANGLTKCIVDFLNYSGHFATRINNQGTWRKDKHRVGGGYYTRSTQVKGIADIDSIVTTKTGVLPWKIEVKINDRQSEAQKEFQSKVERAGAKYSIFRDFDSFYQAYCELTGTKP